MLASLAFVCIVASPIFEPVWRLPFPMPHVELNTCSAEPAKQADNPAVLLRYGTARWPNVYFAPTDGEWDWTPYARLVVHVYNPETEAVTLCVRIDNPGADGTNHCLNGRAAIPPQTAREFAVPLVDNAVESFWGMRGVPGYGPQKPSQSVDLRRVVAFQLFLPEPGREHTLYLLSLRLEGSARERGETTPLPFVDAFGQYIHDQWPGKIQQAETLRARDVTEDRLFALAKPSGNMDRFGGWGDGPQREATGWFRTEKINGWWWLVTPEGHLFLSVGVNCVNTGDFTFIDGRQGWFAWLPAREDPVYAPCFAEVGGSHSMAEPIGGRGRVFNFYRANLIRRFGDAWADTWRERTERRLQRWGINTLGNWCDWSILEHSSLPFTVGTSLGKAPRLEGATGYWGKMYDVYDPRFREVVEENVKSVTARWANEPRCIGYFVDNELAWEGVTEGLLNSPDEQPARKRFLQWLEAKYGTADALSQAWGVQVHTLQELRQEHAASQAAAADLDTFLREFARVYFSTVRDAVKRHAPHQLYLGCRFSTMPQYALEICAEYADIVTMNLYRRKILCTDAIKQLDKPVLVGEFHFGALDSGLFHTGLVATPNQSARAEAFYSYMRSVLECPNYVGAHWFQYVDEPLTGRWYDGENYNIGLVNVVDAPYGSLVAAFRRVADEMYTLRYSLMQPSPEQKQRKKRQ